MPLVDSMPQSSTQIGNASTRRTNDKLNNSIILNRSVESNTSDIITLIVSNTKDAKISLNKLI